MKELFYGYYGPTEDEYKRLWAKAVISVDTNVLLNLYRLPVKAREEFLGVLDRVADRLWVSHHVAVEFHRTRLGVIATERKRTADALNFTKEAMGKIRAQIEELDLEKRALNVDGAKLLADLDRTKDDVIAAISKVGDGQPDIGASDSIRDRLDKLLHERIGPSPSSQAEYEQLIVDAEARYANRVPPGYKDSEKDKNPLEATFVFDGIRYERKYGDLIIWRQLIAASKANKWHHLIMITGDRKEDWWWIAEGKTLGPRPELFREMRRESGTKQFWMYTSAQFLEFANRYLEAAVSKDSVAEVEQISEVSPNVPSRVESTSHVSSRAEQVIWGWLIPRAKGRIKFQTTFPEIVETLDGRVKGYEIKFAATPKFVGEDVSAAIKRGYTAMTEGKVSEFVLIIVIDNSDQSLLLHREELVQLGHAYMRLTHPYPITQIILGVLSGEGFGAEVTIFPQNRMISYQRDGK